MKTFLRNHPYLVAFAIVFLLLFLIGIFGIDATLGESLLGAAALSAIGVGGYWWKEEGLG